MSRAEYHPETEALITVEPWGEQAWPTESAYREYLRTLDRGGMGGSGNGDGGY